MSYQAIARKWRSQYVQTQIRLNNLVHESVVELHVSESSPVANRKVRDVDWVGGSIVASIRRGHKALLPHGNTDILPGDELTIVVEPEFEIPLKEQVLGHS